MLDELKDILEIQEFDMQMIRLMRLKKDRQKELNQVAAIRKDLESKVVAKEGELLELQKQMRLGEGDVEVVIDRQKKLEAQQSNVKKVDEFNALSQEISSLDRERVQKEQQVSDLIDRKAAEDDILKTLKETLKSTVKSSQTLIEEVEESIQRINDEGRMLKAQRDKMVQKADPEIFAIYERLLRNKKDRVVVPIENRCCSGCHIMLTAQDENVVRKGERIVFCEHCSRIQFWQNAKEAEGTTTTVRQRRRRTTAKTA
jgi:predicted  nucleic acid-binding Zn-ribbon protein